MVSLTIACTILRIDTAACGRINRIDTGKTLRYCAFVTLRSFQTKKTEGEWIHLLQALVVCRELVVAHNHWVRFGFRNRADIT